MKADELSGEEKYELEIEIKNAEESIEAMKIARDSLRKFISSFKVGLTW